MHPPSIELQPCASTASLEQLYAEQHFLLRRYVQRIVGDWATAEDVAQDTFVKALRGWSQRQPAASLHAWLYRIASNTAYDELRRRRRAGVAQQAQQHMCEVGPSFDSAIVDADALCRAMRAVPAVYRAPLLLHVHGGQRLDDVARQLNVAVGTVKSRLHRGRAHFRRAYHEAVGA